MNEDYMFGNPDELSEAIKRNEKIALEQGVDMKPPPGSVGLSDFTKRISENSNVEDRLWKIIFDLIEEIKVLKGEKNDQ